MQVIINITDAGKITALQRATDAYNASNNTTLTSDAFLQLITDQNLDAFVAVHTKSRITKFEFLSRFTQVERVNIRAAAAANGQLYDFMNMLEVSGIVELDNPVTIAGVTALETAGLIAVGRSEILLAV